MSIEYTEDRAVFKDTVSVDEAEPLLDWITSLDEAVVDLSECTHIHTSVMQVLMAAEDLRVEKLPGDKSFRDWLENSLNSKKEK